MEVIFSVKADEFDEALFNEIKSILSKKKNLKVTIAINEEQSAGTLRTETKEEYFARLDKAIDSLNKGNSISFTAEEFETFSKQLLNEP